MIRIFTFRDRVYGKVRGTRSDILYELMCIVARLSEDGFSRDDITRAVEKGLVMGEARNDNM